VASQRTARRLRLPRIPAHVGVFLGISTAAYAVTLAGVAANEAAGEAAVADARAPILDNLAAIGTHNDELAAAVQHAAADYQSVLDAYNATSGQLTDFQAALAGLSRTVAGIDGVSRSLPTAASLPKITVRRVTTAAPPPAHGTTGASGAP